MIKLSILEGLVRDNLLHNKIYKELDYRQNSISQSFNRSFKDKRPRGKSHQPEVLAIVAAHLNINIVELLDEKI
jgi:hypothetical protein